MSNCTYEKMKKLKKALVYACTVTTLLGTTTAVYVGASKVLNGGGAKWTGGETSNGILYSNLYDMEVDGIQYKVTVWVDPDWSTKKEKSGTTDGKGKKGRVHVGKASTHKNPFVPEKCGYKDFKAIAIKK